MLDTRLYRMAFLPVVAAVVVLMFSLEPAPPPLQEPVSTPAFEASDAAKLARMIASTAPDRTPGSADDNAIADMARNRFSDARGGEVAEQTFETSVDGSDVEARNVVLTIPGESEETLLLVAPRDNAAGTGATTSASATATLLTISAALADTRHNRTIILASTSGSIDGGKGVRELVDQLPSTDDIVAAIVIARPGVEVREPPFVFSGHAGPDSVRPLLFETADAIASNQFEQNAAPAGAWTAFARLAMPVGIGEGTALADEGLPALTISGSGERPPEVTETDGARISTETLYAAGTSTLDLLLTLDGSTRNLDRGPTEYVHLGSNVIPGWTFKLLALALIFPALATAIDVWVRDRRRNPRETRRAVPWALERILLPLAGLVVAYLLGFAGLIPSPSFPYDPGGYPTENATPIAFAIILLAVALAALLVRPMRTPLDVEPQTLAAAAGILGSVALVVLWLINPYLTLLLTPTAHAWLFAARPSGPVRPRRMLLIALLTLVPAIAAAAKVGTSLDLGFATPWHLLLLIADGHLGLITALLWCVVLGGLIACIGAAGAGRKAPHGPSSAGGENGRRVRGPSGYAGPGSLGGTPSSLERL